MIILFPDKPRTQLPLKPFIGVHVPKTGGNSMFSALNAYASEGDWVGDTPKKHDTAWKIRREFFADSAYKWDDFFKFGIVCSPWEYCSSLFHFRRMMAAIIRSVQGEQLPEPLKKHAAGFKKVIVTNPNHPLHKWAMNVLALSELSFSDHVAKTCRGLKNHGGLTRHWLMDWNGGDMVDFIGRKENLEADFAHICQEIGFGDDPPPLPVHNQTIMPNGEPRHHYREDFTSQADIDRVSASFWYDLDRWGYEF